MKNKKVLLVVFCLLIGVSISFAYFVGRSLTSGSGASLTVKTATLNGTKMKVEGNLSFNDEFIYPGHTEVSSIKVTAIGNNELIPYNLIWKGINSLYTSLNYKVYRSDKKIEVEASCEKKKEIVDGKQLFHEICDISNESELGKEIYTGTIGRSEENTKVILAEDEYITSTEEGTEVYYYVVIEYPNNEDIENNQNEDIEEEFNGEVTVEKGNEIADFSLMAIYLQEGTSEDPKESYKKVENGLIPTNNVKLNEEQTYCVVGEENLKGKSAYNAKGVYITINKDRATFEGIQKAGTKCYLYFDLIKTGSAETTKDNLNLIVNSTQDGCPTVNEDGNANITSVYTENKGLLCEGEDDYGKTYYFRGHKDYTNNWLKIVDTYWRIVRINGNGTIRLIYNGKTTSTTGEVTMAFNGTKKVYNDSLHYNDNAYVGFMYGTTGNEKTGVDTTAYDRTHMNTNPSNILNELNTWYNGSEFPTNAKQYVDGETGFCNDRTPYQHNGINAASKVDKNNYGMAQEDTYYGPYYRINITNTPTFKCPQENDLFTMQNDLQNGNQALPIPVGLITSDEVEYAGAYQKVENNKYYLYNGQIYWTMSPPNCGSYASIYYVKYDGSIDFNYVNSTNQGVRPVINLKADTPFVESTGEGEWGSSTNPFVVKLD